MCERARESERSLFVCVRESERPLLQSGNPCKAVCHVRLVEGAKHVVSESGMDSE